MRDIVAHRIALQLMYKTSILIYYCKMATGFVL